MLCDRHVSWLWRCCQRTCTPAHLHTCTPAHLHTCTPAHLHTCLYATSVRHGLLTENHTSLQHLRLFLLVAKPNVFSAQKRAISMKQLSQNSSPLLLCAMLCSHIVVLLFTGKATKMLPCLPSLLLCFSSLANTRRSDGHVFSFTLNANEPAALKECHLARCAGAEEWVKYHVAGVAPA